MLQELLNLGLVNIGADDSRFAKMEAASEAFVATLKKDPGYLIPATLVALDSDANEDEPIFSFVENLVISEWKTLRNTHVNRPRELLRSIIIDALAAATEGSPEISGVVWHTAISRFNHGQTRLGKESDLVAGLLNRVGEAAEREAVARVGMVELAEKKQSPRKTGEKGGPKLQSYSELKDEELFIDVARAAGPQNSQGSAMPTPNQNWPHSGQPWSNEFSPRMTMALVKAVNLGLSRLSESISSSMTHYNTAIDQRLTDYLDEIRVTLSDALQASNVRLDVLWWTEAKYSPSLRCGYFELPPVARALAMAHDLAEVVPVLAPASVTYVLGEAAASISLPEAQTERRMLRNLLSELAVEGSAVKELFPGSPRNQGLVPLMDLLIEAAKGSKVTPEDLRTRSGVNPSLELSMREFTMWVFRDLQARKLVEDLK